MCYVPDWTLLTFGDNSMLPLVHPTCSPTFHTKGNAASLSMKYHRISFDGPVSRTMLCKGEIQAMLNSNVCHLQGNWYSLLSPVLGM